MTPYWAVQPPSIGSGEPVIVAAASEHRKTASAPTDSGAVKASIGCFSARRLSDSVATSVPAARAIRDLGFHQGGEHPPRAVRVDRDAVVRQLQRGYLGRAQNAVFGRDVGDFVGARHEAVGRGHVDDPAPALLLHRRDGRTHRVEHRGKVEREDRVPASNKPKCAFCCHCLVRVRIAAVICRD